MAKTSNISSRAGESSILRVARATKFDPRGAKLRLECGLDGQVGPKIAQNRSSEASRDPKRPKMTKKSAKDDHRGEWRFGTHFRETPIGN